MPKLLTLKQIADATALLVESLIEGAPVMRPQEGTEYVRVSKLRHVVADPILCPELRYSSTWLTAPLEIFVENVVRKSAEVMAEGIRAAVAEEPGHEVMCVRLEIPKGIEDGEIGNTGTGILVRAVRAYDIEFDSMVLRFDISFALRPISTLSLVERTLQHQIA